MNKPHCKSEDIGNATQTSPSEKNKGDVFKKAGIDREASVT
jgi:hypothetical protein